MVIISMLLAMVIFLFVIGGILVFLVGLTLGIIWLVKRNKNKKENIKKKSTVVLGILSLLFMVTGLLTAVVPTVFIKGAGAVKDTIYNSEISQFDEDEIATVDHYINLDKGFDYNGTHYVQCPDDIRVPKGEKTEAGAIVFENRKHYLLYKTHFDYGDSPLCTESGVYCPEDEIDAFLDYYRNNAPLYGKVSYYDENIHFDIDSDKLDSGKIREIRDYIEENGKSDRSDLDEEFSDADDAHIDFYSTDDAIWISMSFYIKDDEVMGSYNRHYAKLPKEYEEYIRDITKKE